MAVEIITSFEQICDANGDPVSGALISVYDPGRRALICDLSRRDLAVAASLQQEGDGRRYAKGEGKRGQCIEGYVDGLAVHGGCTTADRYRRSIR